MSIIEKVAYLKGLAEGLGVDETTKEGRLFKAMVEVLDEMSESLQTLEDYTDELTEQVDAIDEDLDALESEFYDLDEEYDDLEQDEYYDVVCPHCNEEFTVDEETLLQGEISCPHCGEEVEFEIDECDCDCGHEGCEHE